jgi:hypothetical protein
VEEAGLKKELCAMIRMTRTSPPPSDLKGTKSKLSPGETELAEAIKFYSIKKNRSKPFKYKAYKAQAVIEEMSKMFFGKCAYCESKYQRTQPMDVEHYRPKGGVMVIDLSTKPSSGKKSGKKSKSAEEPKLKMDTPGYYWLAANWDNLLPSCIDCNRVRNQKVPDDTAPTGFKTAKVGKGNNFPLLDENKRRRDHKSRKREEPLILDPTLDEPENHLEFTEEGLVMPRLIKREESLKGKASIQVFALQRVGLVQERKARARMVIAQIERVAELLDDYNRRPNDAEVERRLNREWAELEKYISPDEEYAGMARQLIKKFFGPLRKK